ncbi:hypothetical protein MMC25_000208 [Agyrium rufum]|nr:hypothetical protein [Agyrium rufum]
MSNDSKEPVGVSVEERSDNLANERVGMSIEGGGASLPFGLHSPREHAPVHEQMTVAALILSDYKLDSSVTFITLRDNPTKRPDINDFVRGVIWNDDPECELFNNESGNNLSYGWGADWVKKYALGYLLGKTNQPELIRRSHFGDLQWLHAMASTLGEEPTDTKQKVLRWMETMYKLAIGTINGGTPLQETWMTQWFNDPNNYTTVGELLTHRHKGLADIQHRALGSCFHVIQDSYAVGHTRREPLNLGDRVPGAGIKYKPGVADRWGPILNFHTYVGQGHDHGTFDHSEDGSVETLDIGNLAAWNSLVGCRDGLDACIELANHWHRKTAWDEVSVWLDTVVFKLSDKATRADNTVT